MLTKPRARLPDGAALTRALSWALGVLRCWFQQGAGLGGSSPSTRPRGAVPGEPGPNGYFEYTLSSGASKSGAIVVHDLTTSPASYLVYAVGRPPPGRGVAYGQPQANPQARFLVKLSTGSVRLSAKAPSRSSSQ